MALTLSQTYHLNMTLSVVQMGNLPIKVIEQVSESQAKEKKKEKQDVFHSFIQVCVLIKNVLLTCYFRYSTTKRGYNDELIICKA